MFPPKFQGQGQKICGHKFCYPKMLRCLLKQKNIKLATCQKSTFFSSKFLELLIPPRLDFCTRLVNHCWWRKLAKMIGQLSLLSLHAFFDIMSKRQIDPTPLNDMVLCCLVTVKYGRPVHSWMEIQIIIAPPLSFCDGVTFPDPGNRMTFIYVHIPGFYPVVKYMEIYIFYWKNM